MIQKVKIAIFASGRGSNAQSIIDHSLSKESSYEVSTICTNKQGAGVIEIAERCGIPHYHFTRLQFYESDEVIAYLMDQHIDLVVLAGFLWLVPESLIDTFPRRILNIHPALLPKYGGKGMYGHHIHDAVKEHGESASGLTIHQVSKEYDEGNIIFQAQCRLEATDDADSIGTKVLRMEHHFYPKVIEGYANRLA
jgi:phosphoribosylglycinamide formyltransferase 1